VKLKAGDYKLFSYTRPPSPLLTYFLKTMTLLKIAVCWVVAPCSLIEVYRRFRGTCSLRHQGGETSENFYETTLRYNPEGSHLHTRRHENLKSYWCHFHCKKWLQFISSVACFRVMFIFKRILRFCERKNTLWSPSCPYACVSSFSRRSSAANHRWPYELQFRP
jgi:hypothetical protein